MGAPSNSLITTVLNNVNTTPYLALYKSDPTAADTGTEASGGSYARKAITFGSISSGQMSNTVAVTFSNLATGDITHFGIRDAATAGTLKVFGPLTNTAAVISGDEITFPVGSIVVSLSGS